MYILQIYVFSAFISSIMHLSSYENGYSTYLDIEILAQ